MHSVGQSAENVLRKHKLLAIKADDFTFTEEAINS